MTKFSVYGIELMQTGDTDRLTDNIYFAGCSIECPFCFNKRMWDKESGREMDVNDIIEELHDSPSKWIALMGGEPTEQDNYLLHKLVNALHKQDKKVILFTSHPNPFGIADFDAIHIDIKPDVYDDYTYHEGAVYKQLSYGIVANTSTKRDLYMLQDVDLFPLYIKTDTRYTDNLKSKLYKQWSYEYGVRIAYIDERIKLL